MHSFFIEDGDGIITYTETLPENLKIGDLIDVSNLPGGYDIIDKNHTDSKTPFGIINIVDTPTNRVIEVKSEYSLSHTFVIPLDSTAYVIDYDENG